ncbi:hypothetical protein Zmor_021563 [Zophobas morio]|uniref:Uncharacterized protein n=1 Tax=Zophobas morio TaxID=2755281 RepID=A0AA38I5U2_9CUCU|nr:hypothetical protein Zmor_021563 [Zophobas morio]
MTISSYPRRNYKKAILNATVQIQQELKELKDIIQHLSEKIETHRKENSSGIGHDPESDNENELNMSQESDDAVIDTSEKPEQTSTKSKSERKPRHEKSNENNTNEIS